jgi:hypothetical protein
MSQLRARIRSTAHARLVELGEALECDADMHLERLKHVATHVRAHELERLRARERDRAAREQRRDVAPGDLALGVLRALQLPEPLRRQPQLRLAGCQCLLKTNMTGLYYLHARWVPGCHGRMRELLSEEGGVCTAPGALRSIKVASIDSGRG